MHLTGISQPNFIREGKCDLDNAVITLFPSQGACLAPDCSYGASLRRIHQLLQYGFLFFDDDICAKLIDLLFRYKLH